MSKITKELFLTTLSLITLAIISSIKSETEEYIGMRAAINFSEIK